jgi:hypothetical protein
MYSISLQTCTSAVPGYIRGETNQIGTSNLPSGPLLSGVAFYKAASSGHSPPNCLRLAWGSQQLRIWSPFEGTMLLDPIRSPRSPLRGDWGGLFTARFVPRWRQAMSTLVSASTAGVVNLAACSKRLVL